MHRGGAGRHPKRRVDRRRVEGGRDGRPRRGPIPRAVFTFPRSDAPLSGSSTACRWTPSPPLPPPAARATRGDRLGEHVRPAARPPRSTPPSAPAPVPPDETGRLVALRRRRILDTPEEETFDRPARSAREPFGARGAQPPPIDEQPRWIKARAAPPGPPVARQAPRAWTLCAHVVPGEGVLLGSAPGRGTTARLHPPRHRGGETAARAGDGETMPPVAAEAPRERVHAAPGAPDGPTASRPPRGGRCTAPPSADVGLARGVNGRRPAGAACEREPEASASVGAGVWEVPSTAGSTLGWKRSTGRSRRIRPPPDARRRRSRARREAPDRDREVLGHGRAPRGRSNRDRPGSVDTAHARRRAYAGLKDGCLNVQRLPDEVESRRFHRRTLDRPTARHRRPPGLPRSRCRRG